MILTCPECATRYFVDDAKLGGEGKTVRCASCGARWTARAEADLELTTSPELGAMAGEPSPPRDETREFPKALPKQYRAKVAEKNSMRQAMMHGVIWAAMIATVAATIGACVMFRVEVVRLVPRAASAYAMAGLRVNSIGLTFEEVTAHPALQDGHAALVVSGAIRNIEARAIDAPPVRINVLNKVGARVASLVVPVQDGHIAPGGVHHFVIPLVDPPPTAENVEVVFELGRQAKHLALRPASPAPTIAAAAPPSLRPAADEPTPAVLLPGAPVNVATAPAPTQPFHVVSP